MFKPISAAEQAVTRHPTPPPSDRVIYIDMDDTLCDFRGRYHEVQAQSPEITSPQSQVGFFVGLQPLPRAVESFHHLSGLANTSVYILTAPSVRNPHSYTEKRLWVEEHLGFEAAYRLIICPNKALLQGDYLIDDRVAGKGQENFAGELIPFGSPKYPDWRSVLFHPDIGLFSE